MIEITLVAIAVGMIFLLYDVHKIAKRLEDFDGRL